MPNGRSLLLLALMGLVGPVEAQQLLDDFNRPDNTTVGGTWTEGGSNSDGAEILSDQLQLVPSSPGVAGKEWGSLVNSPFGTVLSTKTCQQTWAFNLRCDAISPAGFGSGQTGAAVVLAGSTVDPTDPGSRGYAVVIGGALPHAVRLVRFSHGLVPSDSIHDLLSLPITDGEYLGVRVVFSPGTNVWAMFVTHNAGPFSSPLMGGTSVGTVMNNTYVNLILNYTACLFNHGTSTTDNMVVDNLYVPNECGPTVYFSPISGSTVENNVTPPPVNIHIVPAATTAGTITVALSNGPGCFYGADYSTTPSGATDTITLDVAAGDTLVTYSIHVFNDNFTEDEEHFIATIIGVPPGFSLGSQLVHVFTIIADADNTPTVQFANPDTTVEESAGTLTYTITFNPPTHPHPQGVFTIQLTDLGTTYGGDYTTDSVPMLGEFTVPFDVNAPSTSFSLSVLNDLLGEPTESLKLKIAAVSSPSIAINTDSTRTLTILDDDPDGATLAPGDIVVLGISPDISGCGGGADDEVSFVCFKDITYNTEVLITDNGYSQCTTGEWGDAEGIIRMVRTGGTIPAGQVVTFHIPQGAGQVPSFSAPDNDWTCTNLHPATSLDLGTSGDQLFFLQGGSWSDGAGSNDATYDGTPLYAISTNASYPWSASCALTADDASGEFRSDLPPHMDCFSTSIAGGTTFAKYTGDTTAATQRDWIVRAEDPANWTTYANCTDYHDNDYDWSAAPILGITPESMTVGAWRGSTSMSWFDCANWDDLQVPDSTTDVVIDDNAVQDCHVDAAGGIARCASVLLTSNIVSTRRLAVDEFKTLKVDGPVTVDRTGGNGALDVTVQSLGYVIATDLSLGSVNGTSDEARLFCQNIFSSAIFSGNVTISPGGYINLDGTHLGGLTVGGNFTNLRDETKFVAENSTVIFNGSGDQTFSDDGYQEHFDHLYVAKTGGNLLLHDSIAVHGGLILTSGLVVDTLPNTLVTLEDGTTLSGASNSSFVYGPVQKFGSDDDFRFPVGKNGFYRPAGLVLNTAGPSDAFICEYFSADPDSLIGDSLESGLDHISHCEYWNIERSAGTANARVLLSWSDPASCGVSVIPDLRIAHWDGDRWLNRPVEYFGDATYGELVTTAAETSFSPWTLGSVTANNPLPIELLSFTAVPNGDVVDLAWSTASERDNDHFTVERSADAEHFTEVARVPGAGNSQSVLYYAAVDATPLPGHSYYRLRQTDHDGSSVLSDLVPVYRPAGAHELTVLYGNEVPYARHDFPAGSRLEVRDLMGRIVARTDITAEGLTRIPVDGLARGAYVLRLGNGERSASTRFVY